MADTHYLIIYPEHEALVKHVMPEAKIGNGRFYPCLYLYGLGKDLFEMQDLIKTLLGDKRTMLVKMAPPVGEGQLSVHNAAGISV